jgi:hypothetical protein
VYWLGRKSPLRGIGINNRDLERLKEIKDECKKYFGAYFPNEKIILINNYLNFAIAEESGHFLHLISCKRKNKKMNSIDEFSWRVITEMFGFFFSKLIFPKRPKYHRKYQGFPVQPDIKKVGIKIRSIMSENSNYDSDKIIYQEGYGLGNKLFKFYETGLISKEQIKKIIRNPMESEWEPFMQFLNLRYNLLR